MTNGFKNNKAIIPFILVLVVLALIGFAGYYFGFLKFIYAVMMPERFSAFSLPLLAIIFGIAAFFSPCSFTVLPAYIAHHLTGDAENTDKRFGRALYFGMIASLGILTVNLIIGLAIAVLGVAVPFAKDPRDDIPLILGVRIATGFAIAYFGLFAILDKPLFIPFLERAVGQFRSRFTQNTFFYGMFYNGAAIGCTGPILLGLMLYAFSTASFAGALSAFIIFALTMSVLMVTFTLVIALFRESIARSIAPVLPLIKKIAGVVMLVTGLSIALLTLEGNRIFVKLFFPFLE
ncbi:hypothetical protein HY620_00205 [Candidatus Uhrbacteria bacterium]|nr:hypothetical protein [Candidatus Uhrbacteria bacterium]